MANVGYARVSTVEQHEDRQLEALRPYKIDKWFTEKMTAKTQTENHNKPGCMVIVPQPEPKGKSTLYYESIRRSGCTLRTEKVAPVKNHKGTVERNSERLQRPLEKRRLGRPGRMDRQADSIRRLPARWSWNGACN